jgi:hypothetical protein
MEAEMAAKSGTKSASARKSATTRKPAAKRKSAASTKSAASSKPAKRGGLSIPKSARGAASKIAELSRNPLVLEVAAAALVAAAGALMSNKRARTAAAKVGGNARDAAGEAADLAGRIGQAVATAVTNAAHRISPQHGESDTASPARPAPRKQPAPTATKPGAASGTKRRAAPIKSKGAMPYVS